MAEDKKIPLDFNVQIYGDLEPYSSTISKARVRVFYRGLNRNGSFITDEFAEKLISTLPYAPVKGIYDDESQDFSDHGNGLNSLGKAYGVVPENGNGQWERHIDSDGVERVYWCTDVLLWTALYESAKQIPGKCQSMELYPDSIKGEWKEFDNFWGFVFEEGSFLGLQVLGSINGEKVEPCFEGSAFYTLKDQFSEIIEIAKNYNLDKKEEPKMPEDTKVTAAEAIEEDKAEAIEDNNAEVAETTTEASNVADETAEVAETAETVEANPEVLEAIAEAVAEPTPEAADNFEQMYNDTVKELNELKENYSKLLTEKSGLETEFEHLKTERDALKEFKDVTETAEKNTIIEKYSTVLSEDVIDKYREKITEFSAVELDKELCFEAHKNDTLEPNTANFSYKNNETEGDSRLQECLRNYKIN